MPDNNNFLMYKGKPLARSEKTIYYGFPYEPYVAMLQILGAVPDGDDGLMISNKIVVQILSTDETKKPTERIAKKAEKQGLYEALDIASIWLDRILEAPSV
ncbi:MAG: hypothetical protein RR049_05655 [Angelakisella sp.]